ncbi:MAG: hypothetical protein WCG80_04840 [Spirochaetales bacterium]
MSNPVAGPKPRKNLLPLHGFLSIALLTVQFLLGVGTTLFFEFPEAGSRWAAASGGWAGAHVIAGTLLLLLAIWVVVLAFRSKAGVWKVASIVGLVGIVAAWLFGYSFVEKDNDVVSYLMTCSMGLAYLAYGYGLWKGENSPS